MTSPTTHTCTSADGTNIAYTLHDNPGTPILLIMGLSQPGGMWELVRDRLLSHDLCLVIPDNRGVGHSDAPDTPWTMKHMAQDMAAVLTDVGRGKALVCGVSMGGMVAQRTALDHPDLVSGLVLCNTTCGLPHGKFHTPQALKLLISMALFPARATPEMALKLLAHKDSAPHMEAFTTRAALVRAKAPVAPKGVLFQMLASLSHNTGARLHTLRIPTLVLAADEDFLIPNVNSEILAQRIPGSQLRIVSRTGHILPHERPDAVEGAILDVLTQVHAAAQPPS